MTQYEREQIKIVIGMLTALEYLIDTPDSGAEVAAEAKEILNGLVEEEQCV